MKLNWSRSSIQTQARLHDDVDDGAGDYRRNDGPVGWWVEHLYGRKNGWKGN